MQTSVDWTQLAADGTVVAVVASAVVGSVGLC